jgi:hypothetical protein
MYTKLLARAGEACAAYFTFMNWIKAVTRGEDIHGHSSGGGSLPDDRIDALVINALEESPFHPVRSLASSIKIPPTTVWPHLHATGDVVRNLHMVPHMPSLAEKAARVELAIEFKKALCSVKHHGWRYILTGDESWFYFTINPDHAWSLSDCPANHFANDSKRVRRDRTVPLHQDRFNMSSVSFIIINYVVVKWTLEIGKERGYGCRDSQPISDLNSKPWNINFFNAEEKVSNMSPNGRSQ